MKVGSFPVNWKKYFLNKNDSRLTNKSSKGNEEGRKQSTFGTACK